jgi:3-oxoacyl-[acyl-carrier protein] reductase
MNQLDMKGRHAVVTGGASGLGFAMVERLLRSGAQVTVWDYDTAGMVKAEAEFKKAVPGAVVHSVKVD